MTSPTDRTERFSLRLSPDERAAVQEVQERLGDGVSENSAIALMIAEAYHWRVTVQQWDGLPCGPDAWASVQQTADELGITTGDALELLILRGGPHYPQDACLTPAPGFRHDPRADTRQWMPGVPEGPVKAKPAPAPKAKAKPPAHVRAVPSGLPPVPPVTGQTELGDLTGIAAAVRDMTATLPRKAHTEDK